MNVVDAYRRVHAFEKKIGGTAAAMLLAQPLSEWASVLDANPTWIRAGTFDALLAEASRLLPIEPPYSYRIARFVAENAWRAPLPLHAPIMRQTLPGDAYLACARALHRMQTLDGALIFAVIAEDFFHSRAAWAVLGTDARLLRAQIWLAMGRHRAAIPLLAQCAETYSDCGIVTECVETYVSLAVAHSSIGTWREARRALGNAAKKAFNDALAGRVLDAESRCRELGLPMIHHLSPLLNATFLRRRQVRPSVLYSLYSNRREEN